MVRLHDESDKKSAERVVPQALQRQRRPGSGVRNTSCHAVALTAFTRVLRMHPDVLLKRSLIFTKIVPMAGGFSQLSQCRRCELCCQPSNLAEMVCEILPGANIWNGTAVRKSCHNVRIITLIGDVVPRNIQQKG